MTHMLVKHIWRRRIILLILFIVATIIITATLRGS
jgi:hypothetical protein